MLDKKPLSLAEGWPIIAQTLEKLYALLEATSEEERKSHQINTTTWSNTYSMIHTLSTQKPPHDYSEALYQNYGDEFRSYIDKTVKPALRKATSDEAFIHELIRRWENHLMLMRFMYKWFVYLDRFYVPRHQLDPLNSCAMKIFKELVYTSIHERAQKCLLRLVHKDREGEVIDAGQVKSVVQIFVQMGLGELDVYERDLEAKLLEETSEFYARKGNEWISEDSCPEYMAKAEEYLTKEEERVDRYLVSQTKKKLLARAEEQLLSKHRKGIMEKENSGCAVLLRDGRTEDLLRMFRLFQRISDGLQPMSEIFRQHVQNEGVTKLRQVADEITAQKAEEKGKGSKDSGAQLELELVRSVIALHQKYMDYVLTCFKGHTLFHRALKDAFENFCNKPVGQASFAELLASFCDNMLRKGGEKMSDEATEEMLERVVRLIAYISDKDLFGEFYRKKLARRLLQDRSTSEEHERLVLTTLKEQCGAQFTQKMEGMVKDLQLARDKATEFDQWRSNSGTKLPIDLSVTVLTTGFWPQYKPADFNLPPEMEQSVEAFRQFYELANSHRRLQWVHTLGQITLKARFGAKTYDLIMAPQQAAVLNLFNDVDALSYGEIMERLEMTDEDLMRMLHSLSCAKYKLLTKEPGSRTIGKSDKFTVNEDFKDKLRRIKVPLPMVEDRRKVQEDVAADRKPAIEAAIVRVMKMRKALPHQQLIVEVRQQMQKMFNPDLRMVKKCIEGLIEREFLERDPDNANLYKYLA